MFAREGLEGVVAARTSICLIKGAEGALEYRGYSIHGLARQAGFEEVAYLLTYSKLPTADESQDFTRRLVAARKLPRRVTQALAGPLRDMTPIDALRSAVSILAADDPDAADNRPDANLRKAIRLTAALPVIVAAHLRLRNGMKPLAPDSSLGHAANFIYMVRGKRARGDEARALEVAMIVEADHGLNASTFAARVTAGTLADLHAAVVAGIAALKGPLHGSASGEVLRMLHGVGDPARAGAFVKRTLAAKARIPGFGHRIYKAADPRTIHLKEWCAKLAARGGARKLYLIANAVERQAHQRKGLYPNVDLYAAPLWSMLGIPPDLFASMFACARITGWSAHVAEQHLDNRLIRPEEEYIGPLSRPFAPLAERS